MAPVSFQGLCQIELFVSDAQKSLEFYREVFGWQEVPIEIHNYRVLDTGPDCPFGVSVVERSGKTESHNNVVMHFLVEHPEAIGAKFKALTGTDPLKRKVPGYGQVWVITDPDGQKFGLFCRLENIVKR